MKINRYEPVLTGFFDGVEIEHWYNPEGEFVYWDDIKDHIKIVDEQLAEINSLKASLAKLMSSLEQWDEEFK